MLKQTEAIVLRSYPLREADLLVTFFTRDEGKLRSEEHTSELQSQSNLACRLLLEKKQNNKSLDTAFVLANPPTRSGKPERTGKSDANHRNLSVHARTVLSLVTDDLTHCISMTIPT